MSDLIDRRTAMDALIEQDPSGLDSVLNIIRGLPDAQSEVTEEDVIEYCQKRCLCIVDGASFKKYEFERPEQWIPFVLDMYGKGALIDNEKRKKGKWKRTYLDHETMGERPSILYCSICNRCITYPTNYCPHCGADMRDD